MFVKMNVLPGVSWNNWIKNTVIDDFRWYPIHKAEEEQLIEFRNCLKQDLSIGIISEAGCLG